MTTPRIRYIKRKARSKKHITGTAERPRLCVYRSLKHIYAQLINDMAGKTLAQTGSLEKGKAGSGKAGGNINGAQKVGAEIAKKAKELGIKEVIFDRGGRIYHGRVKAVAEGAREGGLKF